jgi:hypothetical protein
MQRRTTLSLAITAVGAVAIGSAYIASRPDAPVAPAAASSPAPEVSAAPAMAAVNSAPVSAAVTPDYVANWIADSTGGDAAKRATAIAALADAPRKDALPVLRRILIDGEPQIDRPLALRSLRDLALAQGDADGAIRDAVRQAIYHGDDLTKTEDVQEVLDIIEESELK